MVATTLQTLDRGLAVLATLADAPLGLKPAELAQRLDVHKAIAYRLVATLETHGLVRRLAEEWDGTSDPVRRIEEFF